MITQEIRKKIPSITEKVRNLFTGSENLPAVIKHENVERTLGGMAVMNKEAYAKFITDVTARFPVGTLTTLRGLAYLPGKIPEPIYIVTNIQEIRWQAPVDVNWHEPRCIYVVNKRHPGASSMCPCQLRPLNKEELLLVAARDKASQVLREETSNVDPSIDNGDFAG